MLAIAALVIATASPGDAVTLTPQPPPPQVAAVDPHDVDGGPAMPISSGWVGSLMGSLAAVALWTRRRVDQLDPLPVAPDGMRVVFVPGHGSPVSGTFDEIMAKLGVTADEAGVVEFDYRWVEPRISHSQASQSAHVDELADGLASLLGLLEAQSDQPIYLIGHSKGAVGIAKLLSRWDRHPELAAPSVVGAALLDPPMSGGDLGKVQSLGRWVASGVPNDGGYSPTHCDLWLWDCHDTRAHLGEAAGVEVVTFRNPESSLANFSDRPEGLRVYDVRDPDASRLGLGAIGPAHRFPLESAAVAACIADEMRELRSCVWPLRRWQASEW